MVVKETGVRSQNDVKYDGPEGSDERAASHSSRENIFVCRQSAASGSRSVFARNKATEQSDYCLTAWKKL